jgi:hypothetical protein
VPRWSGRRRVSIDWHPVPSKIGHPIVRPLAGGVNGVNGSLQARHALAFPAAVVVDRRRAWAARPTAMSPGDAAGMYR